MWRVKGWRASLALTGLLATGCRQQMADQPKYTPFAPSAFFADGQSARLPVAGTVARGTRVAPPVPTGSFPVPVTRALLQRGQERYNVYCSPCHDRTGSGNGMIVQRGFPQPPSFHAARLLAAPESHFYQVITDGYGIMYSYASRVAPADRWAIAAYIRALQLSQHASLSDVPPAERQQLQGGAP
ncbi:MAG TPA: cytochrome c [Stenomitos sp.]